MKALVVFAVVRTCEITPLTRAAQAHHRAAEPEGQLRRAVVDVEPVLEVEIGLLAIGILCVKP